ncbi:DUF1648 domain-containing protein [Metabacillus arenae]|uniref:DUF1648 domain-containing protein n=1 Tax=Metabacillus arenae TaxID=2771434 RepID=A0A926NCR3_9BACI|nr:DUF1648 domain-containing protein [Metabacillus arenae]MBD1381104.1 DUF1648 domain-containing protein [Metabacillus arenae]
MMKKLVSWLLLFMAFGVSIYFYPIVPSSIPSQFADANGTATGYGRKEIIVFLLPVVMLLIQFQFLFIKRLKKNVSYFKRYEKGLESIFLTLLFLLFTVHGAILLKAINVSFNILLVVPISVGIIFIAAGNTLPRFLVHEQQNPLLSERSHTLWNRVARPVSHRFMIGGLIILLCGLIPNPFMIVSFFTVLALTFAAIILHIYRAFEHA